MRRIIILLFFLGFISCKEETLPKPKAYLDLSYDREPYKKLSLQRPYVFEVPSNAIIIDQKNNWLKIKYPQQKASIDITYRPVENNLKELLIEAQRLVFEHTVKADEISSNDYVNFERKVFGSVYEITGNAASQIQFHVTDSVHNFIKGALYFKSRPNYDSVLPAVYFIKQDILNLMETLEWKN